MEPRRQAGLLILRPVESDVIDCAQAELKADDLSSNELTAEQSRLLVTDVYGAEYVDPDDRLAVLERHVAMKRDDVECAIGAHRGVEAFRVHVVGAQHWVLQVSCAAEVSAKDTVVDAYLYEPLHDIRAGVHAAYEGALFSRLCDDHRATSRSKGLKWIQQ